LVSVWSLVRESLADRRYQRSADQLSNIVNALYGRPVSEALNRFGAPMEEVTGGSGRSLYTWKSPPATGFPVFDRVVILTLTADQQGVVRDAEWHRW
jgi:hypothetical protein